MLIRLLDYLVPARLPDLPEERFELYLINPEDWYAHCREFFHSPYRPNFFIDRKILDKFVLSEEEHVLSMKVVHIRVKEGDKMIVEPLIALGEPLFRFGELLTVACHHSFCSRNCLCSRRGPTRARQHSNH